MEEEEDGRHRCGGGPRAPQIWNGPRSAGEEKKNGLEKGEVDAVSMHGLSEMEKFSSS